MQLTCNNVYKYMKMILNIYLHVFAKYVIISGFLSQKSFSYMHFIKLFIYREGKYL